MLSSHFACMTIISEQKKSTFQVGKMSYDGKKGDTLKPAGRERACIRWAREVGHLWC